MRSRTPEDDEQLRACCIGAIDKLRRRIAAGYERYEGATRAYYESVDTGGLKWWEDELAALGGEMPAAFLSHNDRTYYREMGRA